jgi:very-short-patch-repair endonuclease
MTKKEPTKYALVLGLALKEKNIEFSFEHWDGYKHVDIYIPSAKINIEIDGLQHYTQSSQIISDFHREYYADSEGSHTLHIPNVLIREHLAEISNAIEKVVKTSNQDR